MSKPPPPERSSIDEEAAAALQDALAAEHAAIWCYGLAIAFLGPELRGQARTDLDAHRELRKLIELTLTQIGARPISAQPAYATPQPVVNAETAAALAVVAETDALGAWRSVMEHTRDRGLRKASLDALTKGTGRCAAWRTAVGTAPAVPPFPGRP
ncbi:ferritin-like domain-containing protein [Actinomycetes bacterium KLBMP 9759]